MAIFNGTQIADTISGTNDDDIITGLAGQDVINGAGGNDTITGGADNDDIFGGAGDDTIIIESVADLNGTGSMVNEKIDGGDGIDTLVSGLLAGDQIYNDGTTATGVLWGSTPGVITNNLEFVQVSNASDFLLDLSADATFISDTSVTYDNLDSKADTNGTATIDILNYAATTGVIGAALLADEAAGVVIGGTTYHHNDIFETAEGGTVTVAYSGTPGAKDGDWSLSYTAAADALYAVGNGSVATDDITTDTMVATVTDANGATADVALTFAIDLDKDFDATAATAGITSHGDTQANLMTGSNFDDVIWAGKGDMAIDTLNGLGGNDILAGGGGNDIINGGAGIDTIYGGDGNDDIDGGADNDVIWAGKGDDTTGVDGGAGDDIIGGGDGADTINGGTGDDLIFGGADDGGDTLNGDAGNDTIYAGDGVDTINGGTGDDLIFNGAGNDTVHGDAGDDTIWGGAGKDTFWGDAGDDTFAFAAGNGNDTIRDFEFGAAAGEGDVLDLSELGVFANTQAVINAMTEVGNGVSIAIAPGQTIIVDDGTNLDILDFQTAVDDWVLV